MYQGKGVTFDASPSQRETDENGFLHEVTVRRV